MGFGAGQDDGMGVGAGSSAVVGSGVEGDGSGDSSSDAAGDEASVSVGASTGTGSAEASGSDEGSTAGASSKNATVGDTGMNRGCSWTRQPGWTARGPASSETLLTRGDGIEAGHGPLAALTASGPWIRGALGLTHDGAS